MDDYTRFLQAVRSLEVELEPAVACGPGSIPVDAFFARMEHYRALTLRHYPDLAGDLEQQAVALASAPAAQLAALVGALARGDMEVIFDQAESLRVAPERLLFLGELTVRAYLSAYAHSQAGRLEGYRGVRCPVCGRTPHMGHIDPDNVKYLHCALCDTVWRAPRVGCVHCGAPESITFLTVEEDEEHRVERCAECSGYLKVVDQRKGVRPIDWLVEDAATRYLDQLARGMVV